MKKDKKDPMGRKRGGGYSRICASVLGMVFRPVSLEQNVLIVDILSRTGYEIL